MTSSKGKRNVEGRAAAARSRRLAPELRRAQIMDTAARMVVEQGYLPLPIEQLARAAGASKALVYTYFPTQYALFNALLEREFNSLILAGFETASRIGDLDQAAQLCAIMYYEHVARSGPLLHILMTDLYMKDRMDAGLLRQCELVKQRLMALATPAMPLSEAEIAASLEMITAIPEEAGRLVFHGELDPTTARQICNGLIASSLSALRAPEKVPIPD